MPDTPQLPDLDQLAAGLRGADRGMLGRAITLVESRDADKRALGEQLLEQLLSQDSDALRIGITGVPGVGKSTFIDSFGTLLTQAGHRVAVLAVDPSSPLTGGSILGDKTRMEHLAQDPAAFIRPSPSSGTLGGVAARTYETMLLCEAAGYDVILVETVGVGQSETVVEEMVDFFLVLMLAGAGDELQGIKRGILELADVLAINKCDGQNRPQAEAARVEYGAALRLLRPKSKAWSPAAVCVSACEGTGLPELWSMIGEHRSRLEASGERRLRRSNQLARSMWREVQDRLFARLHADMAMRELSGEMEEQVRSGQSMPSSAAGLLLDRFLNRS